MAVFAAACSDEVSDEASESESGGKSVMANLLVRVKMASPGGSSRAEGETLSGSDTENKITGLALFLVGVDDEGSEDWSRAAYAYVAAGSDVSGINEEIPVRMKTTTGKKYLYAGANLTSEQIGAIRANGMSAVYASTKEGKEITGEFVDPMRGVAMTGKSAELNSADALEEASPLEVEINMTRVVAKVLLTCDEGESGQVVVNDPGGNNGWIELKNVYFMLNTANKKLFFMPEGGFDAPNWKDPNWEASDFLNRNASNVVVVKDPSDYQKNFLFYNNDDFQSDKVTDPSLPPFDPDIDYRQAVKHEDARMLEATDGHYTEGLYCLENTAHTEDGLFTSDAEWQTNARYYNTYMVVCARYVPKCIDGETFESMSAAEAKLKDQGDDYDIQDGTFWFLENKYYSYQGMREKINVSSDMSKLDESDFTCYAGGWGFYYTYLEGEVKDGKLVYSDTGSRVERNRYYILRCTAFNVPGNSMIPEEEMMMVNSYTMGWTDRGKKTIIIQ